jgi:2-succinyl-6-hydroxy-2,4-cyclohexadiene-1-carboxylate synthase
VARIVVGELELALQSEGPEVGVPLLVLHGFLGSGAEMLEAARRLTPQRRVLALDLPGHGASSAPAADAPYQFEAVVAALHAGIDQLGLIRFDLWGYSLGGRLAIGLALTPGIRIRKLILESCSPGLADPVERAARVNEDNARAVAIRADLEGFLCAWERQPLFAGEQRRIDRGQSVEGLARAVSMLSPGRQPPLQQPLATLPTPTLWLTGERDPRYVAIAREAAEHMPHAHHRIFAAAGHAPHREQPVAPAAAISTFLQE